MLRLTVRPLAGAGESRLTVALAWRPAPTVPPVTDEIAGCVTVTVDEVPEMKPPALAVIWYWPAAVGRSAVTSPLLVEVELLLVSKVATTELADGVAVVLRVTIDDGPPVAGFTTLKVTGTSALAVPQKPTCGHDAVAVMNVSATESVVRAVVYPERDRAAVRRVMVDVAGRQLPSTTLAVSVTSSGFWVELSPVIGKPDGTLN